MVTPRTLRPSGRSGTVAASPARPVSKLGPRSWKGLAFGALCALIWGIQPIVSKISVSDGLTAADVTVLRFLAARLALLPVAARAPNFPVGRLGWSRAVTLAILAGAPFSLALVGGVAFAPAFHSAVIGPGLTPLTAMLLGLIFLRERLAWGEFGALMLTLVGLVLFSFEGFAGTPAREGAWRGDLLFALSGCMWAGFGFLVNHWKASSVGTAASISILSLMSVPFWAFFMTLHVDEVSLWASLLQALFQGIIVGIVALYFYTRAVALLGAVQAALFVPLTPIVTAAVDLAWLGEQVSLTEMIGMIAVIGGMVLCIALPRE
ncbi:MAG: DMT family transporter [Hyphomicrobiales bacterium]|nr:DMT family transporter [Hyphomicrobiales bacterium]